MQTMMKSKKENKGEIKRKGNDESFRAYKISKQIISQMKMKSGEKEKKPLKNIYTFVTALVVDWRRESYLNIYTY
jgi:hypothetical protein